MNEIEIETNLEALRSHGVVVLRNAFPAGILRGFKDSADACFRAVQGGDVQLLSSAYRFTPYSYSVLLTALSEFGAGSHAQLLAPLTAAGLSPLLSQEMGSNFHCSLENSWLRKRFAPHHAPAHYHPNSWHQDGGLGVPYNAHPQHPLPMTKLLTCWIPLQGCDGDCPGLEFIRRRVDRLVHYTELSDGSLRQRYSQDDFWAPELRFGDGLVFLADSLHRTYERPEMTGDRLSIEYRFFPD